ncbi:ABC transporter ATP-binding protein [Reyranella sp.]|uniref:ABC transporter ATP-binding protein n=1 Tax=Reyranella sp. TaxID=1929291 RepID=UPI003BAC61CC
MAGDLSVRAVSRAFGGLQAVRSVSFDVAPGEILGIIGPNGAGKSTLFNMIAGEVKPDSGSVSFEGQVITGRAVEAIARRGLVKTFQTSRPFGSLTFLENVMVAALSHAPSMAAARAAAREQLERVGLGHRADVPSAWASTGQRKRLDIARALATRPRLLLLDEPFGGVDLPSVDSLIALLQALRSTGITLVVIEHNLDAVQRLVDRLIALHLGEIVTMGTPAQVTSDERVIRAYLGASEATHA